MSSESLLSPSGGIGDLPLETCARILLVDDRPEKLLTIAAALAPLGRPVVTADSGREALRWLLKHDFAVVLLDLNMPGMDGFETARLIRRRPRNQHTPIIFLTAYGDDMHAVQGYSLGAVDFLVAPVVPEVLRSKVGVFVELFERTLEARRHAVRLLERTWQLEQLASASLEIHQAASAERLLQIAVDRGRVMLGGVWACAVLSAEGQGIADHRLLASSCAEQAADCGTVFAELKRHLHEEHAFESPAMIVELAQQALTGMAPDALGNAPPLIASPLRDREGRCLGAFVVAGPPQRVFSREEESLLTQLVQITVTAIENSLFAEVREANRIKDEFLATLSHELRTPLSAILGWAQLLKMQSLDPQETIEAVEIIERNGRMQHKLIEDLLDVSRIVTGKLLLNLRPIHLEPIIREAVNVILPAAEAKHVAVEVSLDVATDEVLGDPDRLQQVLWNLLSNALKFTPEQGNIVVRLEADSPQARVIVSDSGEGISPEFLPFVFDRFRQADGSASRRHGGLGIGLAIVRHVVELHGGTVEVASDGRGKGATFRVLLPLAARAASALPRIEVPQNSNGTSHSAIPAAVSWLPTGVS